MRHFSWAVSRKLAAVVLAMVVGGCGLRSAVLDGVYLAVSETVAAAITGALAQP